MFTEIGQDLIIRQVKYLFPGGIASQFIGRKRNRHPGLIEGNRIIDPVPQNIRIIRPEVLFRREVRICGDLERLNIELLLHRLQKFITVRCQKRRCKESPLPQIKVPGEHSSIGMAPPVLE